MPLLPLLAKNVDSVGTEGSSPTLPDRTRAREMLKRVKLLPLLLSVPTS